MFDWQMEFAVVCTYSWVYDAVVKLYSTEDEALAAMNEEMQVEIANDREAEHEFDSYISCDGRYGKIINHRPWGDTDVTEWRVVRIER